MPSKNERLTTLEHLAATLGRRLDRLGERVDGVDSRQIDALDAAQEALHVAIAGPGRSTHEDNGHKTGCPAAYSRGGQPVGPCLLACLGDEGPDRRPHPLWAERGIDVCPAANQLWHEQMRAELRREGYRDPAALAQRIAVLRAQRGAQPVKLVAGSGVKITAGPDVEPPPSLPNLLPLRGPAFSLLRQLDAEAEELGGRGCLDSTEPVSLRELQTIASCELSELVFRLACDEARRGNGAGWMVWARVWCGLLLLRNLASGQDPDEGEADLMQAILGIDGGDDGGPDIREMSTRLYG